jgi:hypothetical protein
MQHFFRTSFVVLVLVLLVGTRLTAAQTAQFTINGTPVTVPLRPNGSGGWVGSGLSPLPNNIVVGFSSVTDPFLRSTSLTVTLQGQGGNTGVATPVSVLFSAPMSLPAGPTTVTSQAGGANIGPVGVSMAGEGRAQQPALQLHACDGHLQPPGRGAPQYQRPVYHPARRARQSCPHR